MAPLDSRTTSLKVEWTKCQGDEWCPLQTVDLDSFDDVTGVYIIWHGGQNARVVRVGQGDIKDRIRAHRQDRTILAYAKHGLYLTWAYVQEAYLDGVERYLFDSWQPLLGERAPDAAAILVNSPWAA